MFATSAATARSSPSTAARLFFRGTLECAIFPRTGHPPTDVAEWKRIIRVCKAHGLNHIRFHSWCPPEAAFVAADEEGFYFYVEASSWANQSTTLGDGKPVDRWIYEETERILRYYGNHPSFVLMSYGNEPGGAKHKEYLAKWLEHFRAHDPRRLYTSAAGWPEMAENQFHLVPQPRIQGWGEGLGSRINAKPPETMTDYRDFISRRKVPVISHEIGQWCVYPELRRDPEIHRLPQAAEFRDLPRSAGSERHGHTGEVLSAGQRETAGLVLQGRHRIRAAHAGHGRFPVARPARLSRSGHRTGGRARSVLGGERLHHTGRVQPFLQCHSASRADVQARVHHRTSDWTHKSKWRTSARRRWPMPSWNGSS